MNSILCPIKLAYRKKKKKILSAKTFTLLLLLLFIYHIFLLLVRQVVKDIAYPVQPLLFPFLFTDVYFMILFLSAVVYFFADAPFMKSWTMYQIIRTGRILWAWGEIAAVVLQSFAFVFLAIVMSASIVFPYYTFQEGWGKVLYTLSMTSLAQDYDIRFGISYQLISGYGVVQTLCLELLVGTMVITFIGLLMFCVSLFFSRILANIAAMFFVMLPIVQVNMGKAVSWLSFISPVSWLNLTELGQPGKPTVQGCLIMLLMINILLGILVVFRMKTVDFVVSKEE